MTLLAASLSFLFGWVWFSVLGRIMVGPVTVYVAMFVATLATATLFALKSREREPILAALVLVANFAASHWAWSTDNPVLWQGVFDLGTAAYFILTGTSIWQLGIGLAYLLSVAVGCGTWLGIVPDSSQRPMTYLALSHPDLLSLLGHAANIMLGMGAGDAGVAVKNWGRRPVVAGSAGHRLVSGLVRLAKAPGAQGKAR